uniref:LUD domain-containing protein n=1 Tax=mine drainage metagenome TaxID=410659 RepID=E6Q073_9ZZZZ
MRDRTATGIDHRARILGGIRTALGAAHPPEIIAAEYAAIERNYRVGSELSQTAIVERFEDRLREYEAGVYQAPEASEIPHAIGTILRARGKRGLAIPRGIPAEWLPEGFAFEDAAEFDAAALDRSPGVLTSCAVAIAETGTIVLQNAAGQGKRMLSLVPDYHLCVVFASQIVATVPESFPRLEATLPTTFISGPSATADIEMTRIKGVHGPRVLDVLLIGE